MKTILTVILLLTLFAATGCGGGGGSTMPLPPVTPEVPVTPEPPPVRPRMIRAALATLPGNYTWEGNYWRIEGNEYFELEHAGPYDGRIELVTPLSIRLIIEMADEDRVINVVFEALSNWAIDNNGWTLENHQGYGGWSHTNQLLQAATWMGYHLDLSFNDWTTRPRLIEDDQGHTIADGLTLTGVRQ